MNTICAQAASGQLAVENQSRQRPDYHSRRHRVKGPRQILPGRTDRRPAQPPTPTPQPATSGDGAALGLLILGLQDHDLPTQDRREAWLLAEKWAAEYTAARHGEAA